MIPRRSDRVKQLLVISSTDVLGHSVPLGDSSLCIITHAFIRGEQQTISALRPQVPRRRRTRSRGGMGSPSAQFQFDRVHSTSSPSGETGRQRREKGDAPGPVCILGRPGLVLPEHVFWSAHERPARQGSCLPGQASFLSALQL